MGLWETAWGKMSVMTVGSFQVFIRKMTLARVLQVKVHVFPKTSIFIFSLQTINSSSEDRYGEPLISVGYRISNYLIEGAQHARGPATMLLDPQIYYHDASNMILDPRIYLHIAVFQQIHV